MFARFERWFLRSVFGDVGQGIIVDWGARRYTAAEFFARLDKALLLQGLYGGLEQES